MILRRCIMVGCLGAGLVLLSGRPASLQDAIKQVPQFHLAMSGESIAGIPVEQAAKIYEQYSAQLRQLPGVVSVGLLAEGLVVETVKPSALPATVEGLPVIPIAPIDPATIPRHPSMTACQIGRSGASLAVT